MTGRSLNIAGSSFFIIESSTMTWPRFANGQRRIEDAARKAGIVPPMHLAPVHVDEMRLVVAAAEQDEGAIGLRRVVARDAGRIDARLSPGHVRRERR